MLFFPNIDELWLYRYHERNYSTTFDSFLTTINIVEKEKWSILDVIN